MDLLTTNTGLRAAARVIAQRFLDSEGIHRLEDGSWFQECDADGLPSKPGPTWMQIRHTVDRVNSYQSMKQRAVDIILLDNGPSHEVGMTIRWSARATFARFGVYYPNGNKKHMGPLIEVSAMLKAQGCHSEALTTLAHEVAHWIADGAGTAGRGHTPLWRVVAEACGGPAAAERTGQNISPAVAAEIARLRGPGVPYSCTECGHRESFSMKRHRTTAQAAIYRHTNCGGLFIQVEGVAE